MNQLQFAVVGNLTSDPEIRFTPAGVAVCRFVIAHNPRKFDRTANAWTDGEPTFFDCAAWRELAEHAAESLTKGTRVIAFGQLSTRRWESDGSGKTPAGEKLARQSFDVSAIGPELTFATAKVSKAARTARGEAAPDDPWASASKTRPANVTPAGGFDDEPPF